MALGGGLGREVVGGGELVGVGGRGGGACGDEHSARVNEAASSHALSDRWNGGFILDGLTSSSQPP